MSTAPVLFPELSDAQVLEALALAEAAYPEEYATPGELAKALDPTTVQTPALDLIDRALVDVDEGRCDRLIISMPPQEGKSTRISRYGILWLLRRNPDRRTVLISYGEDIARQFGGQIRGDIATFNGTDGTTDLGLRLRSDSNAAGQWALASPARGGMYAIGLYGGITGRPVDVLVIDDPVKDYRAADSELLSEQAWQTWMSVARPRLAPGAPVIVVLTRWHERDLAGRLLTKQREDEASGAVHFDRWRVINIPAQADHDPEKGQTDPLDREPGEFMVSARGRTLEQWEATKSATAPRIWNALYQGRPSPDTGDIFQRQWWRRYETPIWSQEPDGSYRVDGWSLTQSWDMAFKETTSTDYVVGQVWAHRGAEARLVDQVRARLSFTKTLTAVRLLTARWPQATAKLVEEKANGAAVLDSLKKEIGGMIPVNPHESKAARARAVSPFVEAGNAQLPTDEIALFDVGAYIEEAAAFPNGSHDDQVDATSQALQRILLKGWSLDATIAAARERLARTPEEQLAAVTAAGRRAGVRVDAARCPQTTDHRHRFDGIRCLACGLVREEATA